MGQILIIDEKAKENIDSLVRYAKENVLSLEFLMGVVKGVNYPIGDNLCFCISLEHNYKIVFSIEEHPKFKAKHISISCNNKLPPIESVKLLIKEFGFKKSLSECYTYKEEGYAINVIEGM